LSLGGGRAFRFRYQRILRSISACSNAGRFCARNRRGAGRRMIIFAHRRFMSKIKQNLSLLTPVCLLCEWLLVVSVVVVILAFSHPSIRPLRAIPVLALALTLLSWLFPIVARYLWDLIDNQEWRLVISLIGLLVPIGLLFYDVNARWVVSRFYSGFLPIPYRILDYPQKAVDFHPQGYETLPSNYGGGATFVREDLSLPSAQIIDIN
jgi:hypothetical protein